MLRFKFDCTCKYGNSVVHAPLIVIYFPFETIKSFACFSMINWSKKINYQKVILNIHVSRIEVKTKLHHLQLNKEEI